jgi:AcrR family transcriptional regulator
MYPHCTKWYMYTATMESQRDTLLRAALAHVVHRGLADLSLRALAEDIGTSHRMLIYHFGS